MTNEDIDRILRSHAKILVETSLVDFAIEGAVKELSAYHTEEMLKARIADLQWLTDHSTTFINGKEYSEIIDKKAMRELIAQLQSQLDNQTPVHNSEQ